MRPAAAPARWPYRDHRTMAQVLAHEAETPSFVAVDHASGPDYGAEATVKGGKVVEVAIVSPAPALDGRVDRQGRRRLCGKWRVSACRYPTCPLPRAA